jgi:hypothetical protein
MYHQSNSQRRAMGLRGRGYFEKHFEREMLLDRLEALMQEVKGGEGRVLKKSFAGGGGLLR